MAYQSIGLGATANDGSGDTLRDGATKVNANFVEIYTALGDGSSLTTGITATASDVTFTGNDYNVVWDKSASALVFADNAKLQLGSSSDLSVYHDGSNSYIQDAGTGYLLLTSDGPGVRINSSTAEVMGDFVPNGAVTLYYDNSAKVATTSTGISVTGNVTASGRLVVNGTSETAYFAGDIELGGGPAGLGRILFEGASADAHETILTVVDPTADRTISLPNVTGTVITTGDSGTITADMLASDIEITGNQLKSSSTLLIVNSSGSTLKTVIGAGSAS